MLIDEIIRVQRENVLIAKGDLWKTRVLQAIMDRKDDWFQVFALYADSEIAGIGKKFDAYDFSQLSARLDSAEICKQQKALARETIYRFNVLNLLSFMGSEFAPMFPGRDNLRLSAEESTYLLIIQHLKEQKCDTSLLNDCIKYICGKMEDLVRDVHASFRSDRTNQIHLKYFGLEIENFSEKDAPGFQELYTRRLWKDECQRAAELIHSERYDYDFLEKLIME